MPVARLFVVFSMIALCFFACINVENEEVVEAVKARDGVFIHISHGTDDPHRVLMALAMAEKMSTDKDVIVYFDITGVEVVLEGAEDIEFSHFPSAQSQIKTLLGRGVPVVVCPGCLKAAGKTPDDVVEGVQIASKEAFFGFTDGRIITLDY